MKKFMKNCAIAAVVMILLGIAMTATAVIVKGPEAIAAITTHSNELLAKLDSGVRFNVNSDMDFDADIPMLEVNSQKAFDSNGITKLDIELGACELQLLPSEDQYFYAHVDGAGTCQVYPDNETLCMKAVSAASVGASLGLDTNEINLDLKAPTGAVTLYIPKDFHFEEVTLSLGAGEITGEAAFTADQLEVELAAGEITLSNLEVAKLDAEVGAGVLNFAGNVLKSVNAECGMGDLTIELTGAKADFNYDVEVAAGEVTIGNESFGGVAGERKIDNNASKDVNVECAMGNIEISFTEN